ncbi:MAG: NmrA family NAD(P)-binding protein [Rhodoferax sp.]|nr:NmrA family NAD(P)-binding protein [Rhodoferax sp.]
MKRILVTGATGQVGSAVIAALRTFDDIVVRAAVRDVTRAAVQWNGDAHVQPVVFNLVDRASQTAALADCDSLFLLRPPQINDDFGDLIETAAQHGVTHIVFLSVQGAERNRFIPHHRIEQRLMSSGMPYTLLRPAYFMQNFTSTLHDDLAGRHRIFLPAGNARFTLVDVDDIGRVAARVLTQPGTRHHGQTYTLTSEVPLTFQQMAGQLTAGLGTPIRYQSPSPWHFYRTLRRDGREPGLILVMLLLHMLPRFTGTPPVTHTLDTGLIFVAMRSGPGIAGLTRTAVLDGRAGLRELRLGLWRWRVGGRWYALALLTMPVLMHAVLLSFSLIEALFEIEGGVAVVKIKPERDALGRVVAPGRLALRPRGLPTLTSALLPVPPWSVISADADWLSELQAGEHVSVRDARAAKRSFTVLECSAEGALLETQQTVYLTNTSRPSRKGADGGERHATLTEVPVPRGLLHLHRGDRMHLVAAGLDHPARLKPGRKRMQMASIDCTLPQVLPALRKGQRVWFDDGRIGAVVLRQGVKRVELEISQARESGGKMPSDKGINLPDTVLDLPALTPKDIEDLSVAAQLADIIGGSFAQSAGDVRALRQRLLDLGALQVRLILKIETKRGFEHLPEMLLAAAMAAPCAGVMIARGDLAVESGYERMAEVQEEILWACEAAHMPTVWATQVLEQLAQSGLPSRAEITDAAMGERAECVMLNKGPHINYAMRMLDDILRRMQSHQSKKRALMRAMRSWRISGPVKAPK